MIALFLTVLLEGMGHDVCATVDTVAEAIVAAAAYRPDLIIMDGQLRDGSGVAAIKEILRSGFVPHIFVTGDAYRLGTDATAIIVRKPFTEHTLTRSIARALLPVS